MFFLLIASNNYYALLPSGETNSTLTKFITENTSTPTIGAQLSNKSKNLHVSLGKTTEQYRMENPLKVDFPYIDVFTTFETQEDDPLEIKFRPGKCNTCHYCFVHDTRPNYAHLISGIPDFFSLQTNRKLLSISVAARVSTYRHNYFSEKMSRHFGDAAPQPHMTLFKIEFIAHPSGAFWSWFNPFIDGICNTFEPFEGVLNRLYKEGGSPTLLTGAILDLTERTFKEEEKKQAEKQKTPPKKSPQAKKTSTPPKEHQKPEAFEKPSTTPKQIIPTKAEKKRAQQQQEEAEDRALEEFSKKAQTERLKTLQRRTHTLRDVDPASDSIAVTEESALAKHAELEKKWHISPTERNAQLEQLTKILNEWEEDIRNIEISKAKEQESLTLTLKKLIRIKDELAAEQRKIDIELSTLKLEGMTYLSESISETPSISRTTLTKCTKTLQSVQKLLPSEHTSEQRESRWKEIEAESPALKQIKEKIDKELESVQEKIDGIHKKLAVLQKGR